MIESISDLFEVHKKFIGRFSKYDAEIVIFLKRVTDNAATHHSPLYNLPLDDGIVEDFKNRFPDIDMGVIDSEVGHIQGAVRRFFKRAGHLKSSYFEVRCVSGYIVLELQTFEDIIPSTSTLNYNVPWGSPPNTIRATHLDVFCTACFSYLWVEDDDSEILTDEDVVQPCDITIGDRLYVVEPGLYKYEDGELIAQELSEAKRITRNTSIRSSRPWNKPAPSPVLTMGRPAINRIQPSLTRHNNIDGVLQVHSSGNYGSEYYEYIIVELGEMQIKDGVEYDVMINGISFVFNVPGFYQFVDGEFVIVE